MKKEKGLRIYIHDNSSHSVGAYGRALQALPYEISEIVNPQGEDHLLPIKNIDLLILDLKLGDISFHKGKIAARDSIRALSKSFKGKIIIITAISDPFLLDLINSTLFPRAIISKQDVGLSDLIGAITIVLQDEKYYSQSVNLKLIKYSEVKLKLDDEQRFIAFALKNGISEKNMAESLGYSTIEVKEKIRLVTEIINNERLNRC